MYKINMLLHNRNLWKKHVESKFIRCLYMHFLKLESLADRGILQCGSVDLASPSQPPVGQRDQWCVNSDQGTMPGLWLSCILSKHINLPEIPPSFCSPLQWQCPIDSWDWILNPTRPLWVTWYAFSTKRLMDRWFIVTVMSQRFPYGILVCKI